VEVLSVGVCRVMVGTHEGSRSLGIPVRRWEGNVKMITRGTGSQDVDCIHLAQDWFPWHAVVVTVMDLRGLLNCRVFTD
jgi:hypothetical protein